MGLSRRSFLARAAALAAVGGWEPTRGAPLPAKGGAAFALPPVTLRGYGTLAARFHALDGGRSSVMHITCESAAKALLTQAKYLSDLARLPGAEMSHFAHGGRSLPCRRAAAGVVACSAHGRDVLIVASTDESALTQLGRTILSSTATAPEFAARVPVPMYLDRWDRYGLLCYMAPNATAPGTSEETYDFADALTFAHDNGPLGLVLWTNPLIDDYAEGLTNAPSWDWVQENARKMGIPVHINTQFAPPQVWLANRYREQTMLKAPQFLGGYYGVGHDSAGVGAISWLSQEAEDVHLGLLQKTVRRFAKAPNIVGWLEPHGETAETPQKFFLDSGPYADKVWRGFLRRRYGTLRAVSERWHGDVDYYTSWDDVPLPEVAEFAGFGPEAIDLRGVWRVRYAPASVPPEWVQPGFDDTNWDEFIAPGNDRMLSLKRAPLVYRRTLTVPADWLAVHPTVTLYVWDMVNRDGDVTLVSVNGQAIKEKSHGVNEQHWGEFDVSGALRPGPNVLVLQMPRAIICYRAYLTKEPPTQYPHLGPRRNAQWADIVAWNIESRGAQIRRGAEMIRQVDPDRSINFMAADDYYEPVKDICRDYGGRFHDTGAMAGFWTERNTLMMSGAGLPTTAEPGNGAPDVRNFLLFWGRWLTEGVNGVHYFQNWGEIAWNPDVLKVFEANRPLYESVGKYHSPFAQIAVLFSLPNDWLTGFPWNSNQGGYYSAFNAATQLINYCPRDGIGASDFGTPSVNKYRVIVDTNSLFMSEELVGHIEDYVRQGGVFITYGQTGRHTETEPDAWPIRRLTGYDVAHEYEGADGRSVSVASQQTTLTANDLPPQTHAAGLGLKAFAPECQTLAAWDDGATAIGLRPLGAGWVVHLGPAINGDRFVAVVGALLRRFGVHDRVPATCPGVHFRHFISNTGLHDIWVLFNESEKSVTTDLTFLPGVHPVSLTDIVSGQKADIVRDPGGDAVRALTLDRWETRLFLSPRAAVAASPLEWLQLQRGWWQGTKKPPAKHLPTPAEMQRFSLDLTENWACKSVPGLTDDQTAALARPDLDDSAWERRPLGLWLSPDGEKRPRRLVLRRRFMVPAHWTSGPVVLCADVPGQQFYGQTRLFVDGKPWADGRKTSDGPYFDTLGGVLNPGTTHLLTLDIAGSASLLGSQGPFWLYHLPAPQARQDLAGTWAAYSDPLHKTGDVSLPGTVRAMFLSRTVVIDPVHKGRNVVVYFESIGDRLSLLVNGHLLKRSEQVREHITVFHITPMITFGADTVIELVGGGGEQNVQRVELRFYDQDVYP